MKKILVVGAGFAGLVHARELAEAGMAVTVIDKRNHIAGNCFDYIDENGINVHKYGPHLFHTSNQKVVDWLSRFTRWTPYVHSVVSLLPDGQLAPNPINLDTVNMVFGQNLETAQEVEVFIKGQAEHIGTIRNAQDHLYATIGRKLTDLFFRPYTKKMWGMDLEDMDADVVKRLKFRSDRDTRYFLTDSFQALPENGYESLFATGFNHKNIRLELETEFRKSALDAYDYCFNSMAIDEYFNYSLGRLPYRSIKFHTTSMDMADSPQNPIVNYTDTSPYTRETWWHIFPGHHRLSGNRVTRTIEEPCDYHSNNFERYYPIKTSDGRYEKLYNAYKSLSEKEGNIQFIGRCGTYQYLDMHQVINQSLINVRKWLEMAD